MTKDRIEKTIDQLMSIIEMKKRPLMALRGKKDRLDVSDLRDLDASHMLLSEEEYERWFIFAGDDVTPDVIWPINVGMVVERGRGWLFVKARAIKPSEARGKVKYISPKMMKIDTFDMDREGRFVNLPTYHSYINGRWVDADGRDHVVGHNHSFTGGVGGKPYEEDEKCRLFIGHALRQRYEWSVSIGEPGNVSFRFATDPTGIRAILADRDKGDNGRRDALRHWVHDHWRKARLNLEAETYVRHHLRGGESFTWRGYRCSWSPSQYDVELNEKYAEERKVMGRQAMRPVMMDRGR